MSETSPFERPTLIDQGIDFRRFGYFIRPISPGDPRLGKQPSGRDWLELQHLLDQMKAGDFSHDVSLLALLRRSKDWRIRMTAACILGHAGRIGCIRDMRAELEALPAATAGSVDADARELALLYCRAFARWGRLDVVPFLLDQYLTLRLNQAPDIKVLPLLLAGLLSENDSMIAHEPPEDSLEDYLNLVMSRFDEVASAIGSDKAHVFKGEQRSVGRLSERLMGPDIAYPSVDLPELREPFESATGIDCSVIFTSKGASPLAAAALVEDLVDSGKLQGFELGVRYFFGTPVPE